MNHDHLGCSTSILRETHRALGLEEEASTYLRETQGGKNAQHEFVPALWQSVYRSLSRHGDTNDAVRLARDPGMQDMAGRWAMEKQTASSNILSQFGTETLVTGQSLKGLR
jgi:hypothetical protein